MIMFRDGTCPQCGGHAHGTPLRCEKCGWQESTESAKELQNFMKKIIGKHEKRNQK